MPATRERTRNYQAVPIGPDVLNQLRHRDDAGHAPRVVASAEGAPLRCCLRPVGPGEPAALVSYAPLRRWAEQNPGADPGPYDELGPVFIHPEPCAGPDGTGYPAWLAGSHRVLRGYSAGGQILDGILVEPDLADPVASAEQAIAELFSRPDVAFVHARAVEFGCFTFEIRRA